MISFQGKHKSWQYSVYEAGGVSTYEMRKEGKYLTGYYTMPLYEAEAKVRQHIDEMEA